ncbi:metallophosphoesterase [Maribacter sp.]|uniref:metallophosphoesterase n=1 Tax=Maribacter sp. TaxID=1897614 RepID=UPI0025C609FC|nr:metallophosphoesterase [Maribacter sp.]
MKRRSFIKKSFRWLAGLGLLTGFYSWQIEPFWIQFVHLKMPLRNLPDALVGKTLMQISDVHIGNSFDYQYIIDAFKEAQELRPDFVVYTGDYVTYEDNEQITQLREVLKFVVKGTLGTIGILGNHDYGIDFVEEPVAKSITESLEDVGVTMLRNDAVEIAGLNFLGMDDFWGSNFYPEKTIEKYNPTKANITLCHNPDVCDLPVWNNFKGWILSGHTHGGQVKPPFLPPLILPVKNKNYDAGIKDLKDGRTLYINRALGCLRQVRFNVRPEITVFKLLKEV